MAIPTLYSSQDSGAPVVTRATKYFIKEILDACLVTGYGSKTAAGWLSPFTGTAGTTECYIFQSWDGASLTGIQTPSSSNYAVGTSDFTVEAWVYLTSMPSQPFIFDFRIAGNTAEKALYISSSTLYYWENSNYRINGAHGLGSSPINQWIHFAVTRASNVVRMFCNGNIIGTPYTSSTNWSTATTIKVGMDYANSGASYYVPGYIDDFRFVTGTALYTASFSRPTTKLTAITGTNLLINGDGTAGSTTITDASTIGATLSYSGSTIALSNEIADPYGVYDRDTRNDAVYKNADNRYLRILGLTSRVSSVHPFNSMASLQDLSDSMLTPEFHPIQRQNVFWGKQTNYTTGTLGWSVLATNKFFYIFFHDKEQNLVNEASTLTTTYPMNPKVTNGYYFGTIANKQINVVDTIFSANVNTTTHFQNTSFSLAYIANVYSGWTGQFHNTTDNNAKAILNGQFFKYSPFQELKAFSLPSTGNIDTVPDGRVHITVHNSDSLGTITLLPIGLFSFLYNSGSEGIYLGTLPGAYTINYFGPGLDEGHGQIYTMYNKNGVPEQFMLVQVYVNDTTSYSGTFLVSLGNW